MARIRDGAYTWWSTPYWSDPSRQKVVAAYDEGDKGVAAGSVSSPQNAAAAGGVGSAAASPSSGSLSARGRLQQHGDKGDHGAGSSLPPLSPRSQVKAAPMPHSARLARDSSAAKVALAAVANVPRTMQAQSPHMPAGIDPFRTVDAIGLQHEKGLKRSPNSVRKLRW